MLFSCTRVNVVNSVALVAHRSDYLHNLRNMLASLTVQMHGRNHSRTKNRPLQMSYFSAIGSVNNQSDLHILESLYCTLTH